MVTFLPLRELVPLPMADRYEDAVRLLKDVNKVRVLSHHDADGIFSAAILSLGLRNKGFCFHVSLVRGIDEALIGQLNDENNELIVISDMGSGDLGFVERLKTKAIILDHHKPQKENTDLLQINPHLYGMNGGDVLCGSMLSFLFALTLDEDNWQFVHFGIAGAIADKQHLGGFKSANAAILEHAVKNGEFKVRKGLLLEGELKAAIPSSIDPYFGIEDGESAEKLLHEIGIEPSSRTEDLDQKKMQALASILSAKLVGLGARSEAMESLVGNIYWSERVKRSANALANDVNACSRVREEILGLRLCFGEKEAVKRIKELRKEYEGKIMANIRELRAEKSFKKDYIQFFYCGEPRIAGALAGIGMLYFLDQEKATFALTVMDKKTKVSCRGTKYLVGKGLDLASACSEAGIAVGGKGGGHSIASGALIPRGQEEKFLTLADGIIGHQYANRNSGQQLSKQDPA
jgi:single-stranded-DNA-specific exonuclease